MTWGELLDTRPDLATAWTALIAVLSVIFSLVARNLLRIVIVIRKPGPIRLEIGTDSGENNPKSQPELSAIPDGSTDGKAK